MSDYNERPEEEIMTFRIKRGYFYAVLVPLAFLLGIAGGYLAWGRGAAAAGTASLDSSDVSSVGGQATGLIQPTEAQQSVEEYLASLPRYDDQITIESHDPVFGPDDAPIIIIEFSDFECPFCQRHFAQVYPQLLAEYPGQIRFVYKDFPLVSIHPAARGAAMAAQCAFEQDAFWEFHDLLFSGRLELTRSSYETYADELGLDAPAFATCLDEERYADVVDEDTQFAQTFGISSTPTFLVNGIVIVGAQPFEAFAQVIDYELSQAAAENN
jgi:protein-disulfide isomerase